MRIALISREYPPDSGWGGIATYTYHQAQSLKELGHDVEVFALTKQGEEQPSSTKVSDGIKVHRIKCEEPLNNLAMLQAAIPFSHYMLKSVFALARKVFEVHSKNPFEVAEAPEHLAEGLGLAMTRRIPLVIRLHTPQSKLIAEGFHNLTASFDQQFVAMVERLAIIGADVITSPSEDMADYVSKDMNYARDAIYIVRNPVDSDKFCPEGARALEHKDELTMLFVGRLEQRKGIHYLIEAVPAVLKACPKVKFVIIGGDTNNGAGQKSVLAELKESLESSGVEDKVTFVPHVPLADMPAYYRSADVCLVPSLYDNAPCTCLEAMSSGKAIVTTSAGGSSEYVLDGECGLVVAPANAAALAEAIIRLATETDLRRRMGDSGRERVLQNFKKTIIAEHSLEYYKLAIEKFAASNGRANYMKENDALLDDANALFKSFDEMLYNFLYVQSLDFRVKHRLKRVYTMVKG